MRDDSVAVMKSEIRMRGGNDDNNPALYGNVGLFGKVTCS